jgi:hypothetical protein
MIWSTLIESVKNTVASSKMGVIRSGWIYVKLKRCVVTVSMIKKK